MFSDLIQKAKGLTNLAPVLFIGVLAIVFVPKILGRR